MRESITGKLIDNLNWAKDHKLLILLFIIPILAYYPYLVTSDKIALVNGDFDYFLQNYEAVRKIILEYGQFPWWNPWSGGGLPLYANPQVGVFSIPTILVLLFGTVVGLKLSVLFFIVVGQIGAYLFFSKIIKLNSTYSGLLSVAWVLNGFFAARFPRHFTFTYYLLFPLLVYLQLQLSIKSKRVWIQYGLVWGLLLLGSIHYALIQMAAVLSIVAMVQMWYTVLNYGLKSKQAKLLLKQMLLAGSLALILSVHRIIYTFQYVVDFPRAVVEPHNTSVTAVLGLLLPNSGSNIARGKFLQGLYYGAGEYAATIGTVMGVAFLSVLIAGAVLLAKSLAVNQKTVRFSRDSLLVGASAIASLFFIVLAMGQFDPLAPYTILKQLPVFEGMQVSARWLVFAAFSILTTIGLVIKSTSNKRVRMALSIALVLSVVELLLYYGGQDRGLFYRNIETSYSKKGFTQRTDYTPNAFKQEFGGRDPDRRSESFGYEATTNNIAILKGYEPLYETRFDAQGRCGVEEGCGYIHTDNAELIDWSPNRVTIKRTGAGSVKINTAPSNYWVVEGDRLYRDTNVVAPGKLSISGGAIGDTIVLEIRPRTIPQVLINKVK